MSEPLFLLLLIATFAMLGGFMFHAAYTRWRGNDLEQRVMQISHLQDEALKNLRTLQEKHEALTIEYQVTKQERNALQERIPSLEEELRTANAKANLSQGVLHDLAHSIEAADNSLLKLRRLQINEDGVQASLLQIVDSLTIHINHLSNYTRDMKSFLEDYGFDITRKLRMSRFDLVKLVDEIQESRSAIATQQGVDIWRGGETTLPQIFGDREAIRRALTNLVDNGINYADTKSNENGKSSPEVGIELAVNGDNLALIKIMDNGIGIPKELTEGDKLWRQATRAQDKRSSRFKGSGLGLAVVKMYIDAHPGATIQVDSTEGKGTTFTVSLPIS